MKLAALKARPESRDADMLYHTYMLSAVQGMFVVSIITTLYL
jgi:hypothetical protein